MAEYIKETDTLNAGRRKINESIKASERAESKSDEALDKASYASDKSDSTQEQLDAIVIEGDSSVEAAQARVDEKGEVHPTLKARIDDGFEKTNEELSEKVQLINNKKILTVGIGGDFNTINEALHKSSRERVSYEPQKNTGEMSIENKPIEILLLSGFVMEEQVMLEGGVDLGYVVISSEDDEVFVDVDSMTDESSLRKLSPFSGNFNCVLPIINTVFKFSRDMSDPDLKQYAGIYLSANSSAIITEGSGFKNASRGAHVNGASRLFSRGAIFHNCDWGIRISQGSVVDARDADISSCNSGVRCAPGSEIDIRGSRISNCIEYGINVAEGGVVSFRGGVVEDCSGYGVYNSGGFFDGQNGLYTRNETGVYTREGFTNISRGTIIDNENSDIAIFNSSIIQAFDVTTTNSLPSGGLNISDVRPGFVFPNVPSDRGLLLCDTGAGPSLESLTISPKDNKILNPLTLRPFISLEEVADFSLSHNIEKTTITIASNTEIINKDGDRFDVTTVVEMYRVYSNMLFISEMTTRETEKYRYISGEGFV